LESKAKESTEEELRRLRRDNRILKQERGILKKAIAYFAKDLGTPLRGELYKVCVDERLNQLIKDIFYQCREVYDTRRILTVLCLIIDAETI